MDKGIPADRKIRIMIGAGGTSGHINPALNIANHIKNNVKEAEILFFGIRGNLEDEIVKRAGYEMEYIKAKVLPSANSCKKIRWLLENSKGVVQCLRHIRNFKPDIVISTGSYVGSPLVISAIMLRIPVVLHEQNAMPGRSNRLFGKRCAAVCISYRESEKYFKAGTKTVLTGNPIDPAYFQLQKKEARAHLSIKDEIDHIVIMGGSLGAQRLNEALLALVESGGWDRLIEDYPQLNITISTGKKRGAAVCEKLSRARQIKCSNYLFDGLYWLASSDLFIGRAGAMTCAEVAGLGLPSILVPYPYAADDHQLYNAKTFADIGAAILCLDQDFSPAYLDKTIRDLLNNKESLQEMGNKSKTLGLPDATDKIFTTLIEIIEKSQAKKGS